MFRSVTSAHKRLSLSGFLISKNYIYHSGHTQKVVVVKKIRSNKEETVDAQIDYTTQVIKEFENHLKLIK